MHTPNVLVQGCLTNAETKLTLSGNMDVARVHPFYEAALKALERGNSVEVDCTALDSLDCSVVQVLAGLAWGLARIGAFVRLVGVSRPLGEVLRLSGMEAWLTWTLQDTPAREAQG